MRTAEYQTLCDYESWYWWYLAQRANLLDALRDLRLRPAARVLDAGCGTGRNLIELAAALAIEGYGVDIAHEAAALWNGDRTTRRCLGSVNKLPYAAGAFDAVVSVDLLGCSAVDAEGAVTEMARVVRPAGAVVALAPAYQWMRSSHDDAVHSVRRFTRPELRRLASAAGLRVERLTHRFALFFPIIAVTRLWRRWRPRRSASGPVSDLRRMPGWLNRSLLALADVERGMTRTTSVPFGSTILMTARKVRG